MVEVKKDPIIVVLKIDIHCEGCGDKIAKLARSFSGVESASSEMSSGKVTVMGTMSPDELRDFIVRKTKKKTEVISPSPKSQDGKENKKGSQNQNNVKTPNNNNNMSSTVIKMSLHCQGCIEKIEKVISKTKGVVEVNVDKEKETITVTGAMSEKDLVDSLKERFKRKVEVLRKEGGKSKEKNKKENNSGIGGTVQQNAGGSKENDNAETIPMPEQRRDFITQPGTSGEYGYFPHNGTVHGYGYEYPPHLKFNDENPNACTIV